MQSHESTTVLWQLLVFLLDEECATSLPDCLKATRIIERKRPKFEALYRNRQPGHEDTPAQSEDPAAARGPRPEPRSQAPLPAAPTAVMA